MKVIPNTFGYENNKRETVSVLFLFCFFFQNSKILTNLLNTLGQYPHIGTIVKRITYKSSDLSSEGYLIF